MWEVKQVGQVLFAGDRVQTRDGEVQITFDDGAILKVRPFTNIVIEEREEKTGWWIFKKKNPVRRITNFVGKLWFKSGVSKRKNFLQTPTAVCGLRGSDGDLGFDNELTFLHMRSGRAGVTGSVKRGPFKDFGSGPFSRNPVSQSFQQARDETKRAAKTGQSIDRRKARGRMLGVKQSSAGQVLRNPDDRLRKLARIERNVAEA